MAVKKYFKPLISMTALAIACALPVQAADVGGVKVPDSATVGGKSLPLNGAGMRQLLFIKAYAMGLYLPEKKTTTADVLAVTGPRRVSLYIQREITPDELGELFIKSMNKNSTKEEKAKVISQTTKFGEMFSSVTEPLKKGDTITLDWVPGSGTVSTINGKVMGEPLPDIAFNNAMLRIWLGDNPAQGDLKKALLGEK